MLYQSLMITRLTAKTIESLTPPTCKRYDVRDTVTTGLMVRVSSSGKKVFYLSARVAGKRKRFKIGTWPHVSLSDARDKAREILRDIDLGRLNAAPDAQTTPTLGAIVPQFVDIYAKRQTKDWKGTASVLTKFEPIYDRPVGDIKRADIAQALDGMMSTPVRANRALAAIRKLFSWCVDRGILDVSPIAGMKAPTKEIPRDRVLSDDELATIWAAAEADGFPFGPCIQIMILTGQRRNEVAGMRWSELDFDNSVWTIPASRTKNANANVVPLTPAAVRVLRAIPRFEGSDLVFTTTGRSPISGFGRVKTRLETALGDRPDWRLHDLRRTLATGLAKMRVQPHVIEAILNHRSGTISGVAAIYNRHAYADERREALEAWNERVESFGARRTFPLNDTQCGVGTERLVSSQSKPMDAPLSADQGLGAG